MVEPASRGEEVVAEAPLGYLLRAAAGAHRLQVDRALTDLGVTAPQFLILTLLLNEAGLSNADLARSTGHTTPTVSAIVHRLKASGFIESRAHPVHGRIRNLYLTNSGRERRAACAERVQTIEHDLAALATPRQVHAARTWLQQVSQRSGR